MKIINYLLVFGCIALLTNCTTAEIPIPDTTPIIEKVTYEANVKAIIDNNCITCHGTVSPSAGLTLVNYSQVRNSAENGTLIARMNSSSNPMPPNGKLVQSSLDLIDKWKEDGFLEN